MLHRNILLLRANAGLMHSSKTATLFDHLVGAQQKRFRDCQPKRLRGLEIDDEIEFGRLLDWNIAWLRPAQNLVNQVGGAPV
jgi:hypothetical protein